MDSSASIRCQYEHWWTRKRLQPRNEHLEELDHEAISLPLPSFPPVLDFDPGHYLLPPPYEDVIDIEKALYRDHFHRSTRSDASTLCPSTASPDLVLQKAWIQEPYVSQPKRYVRIVRHLRYTIFTVYRRFFTLVFVLNCIGPIILIRQHSHNINKAIDINTVAALASTNFLVAVLIRQDFLVNLLFRTAWLVPWYVPLKLRRIMARVYCYGGIHSGAAVAGTMWWIVFTVVMSWTFMKVAIYTFPVVLFTWVVLILLVVILLLSLPHLRRRYHDTFEITHRFMGWTSTAVFWVQILLLTHHTSANTITHKPVSWLLVRNPTFWNLVIITILLIYPWLRLRRWTFTAHPVSSHALLLSFPNEIHRFSCLSISSSPLREWHPFATFPSTDPDESGASMVISDAGDWTKSVIQSAKMRNDIHHAITKQHMVEEDEGVNEVKMCFWVKSHPKAGVLSLSCLFPRVLIVTTGSGIGPSLSSLLDRPQHPTNPSKCQFAHLIWSTRSPLHTYGPKVLDLVHKADPGALVIDTSEMGRPNLLELAWTMYKEVGAEAVFVLSNEVVTRSVVGGLEGRGIPAFGPIWDS